jgi:hypothetical protein
VKKLVNSAATVEERHNRDDAHSPRNSIQHGRQKGPSTA